MEAQVKLTGGNASLGWLPLAVDPEVEPSWTDNDPGGYGEAHVKTRYIVPWLRDLLQGASLRLMGPHGPVFQGRIESKPLQDGEVMAYGYQTTRDDVIWNAGAAGKVETLPPYYEGAWSSSKAYLADDFVVSGGTQYRCILGHTNHVPPNGTYWVVDAYSIDMLLNYSERSICVTDLSGFKEQPSGFGASQRALPSGLTFLIPNGTPAFSNSRQRACLRIGATTSVTMLFRWSEAGFGAANLPGVLSIWPGYGIKTPSDATGWIESDIPEAQTNNARAWTSAIPAAGPVTAKVVSVTLTAGHPFDYVVFEMQAAVGASNLSVDATLTLVPLSVYAATDANGNNVYPAWPSDVVKNLIPTGAPLAYVASDPYSANYLGAWGSGTAYTVGQVVQAGGLWYVSIQNGTNKTPSTSPTYWTQVNDLGQLVQGPTDRTNDMIAQVIGVTGWRYGVWCRQYAGDWVPVDVYEPHSTTPDYFAYEDGRADTPAGGVTAALNPGGLKDMCSLTRVAYSGFNGTDYLDVADGDQAHVLVSEGVTRARGTQVASQSSIIAGTTGDTSNATYGQTGMPGTVTVTAPIHGPAGELIEPCQLEAGNMLRLESARYGTIEQLIVSIQHEGRSKAVLTLASDPFSPKKLKRALRRGSTAGGHVAGLT